MPTKKFAVTVSGMILAIIIIFHLFVAGCWIGNLIKLTDCDFEPPYKGEIIHGIGLLGYPAIVTVWFNDK